MIRVERPASPQDVARALNKRHPEDDLTELERARAYYEQRPPPTKAYGFKRYKEWAVCLALDELFHEKCAYCESTYRAVDSSDVEHFRPKGAVTEAPHHPGYWWLAGDWNNLLPSCPPCNQKRRQLIYDEKMTLEEFENARLKEPSTMSGKANSFPLLKNDWVTDENGNIQTEDPLLINPCDRDPDAHLEWVFEWESSKPLWEAETIIALVRPRQKGFLDGPYGKASIAVYGLNRAGLVRERMARIKEMQVGLQSVVDVMIDLADTAPDTSDWVRLTARLARYKKDFVATYATPKKPYAGMAKAFMRRIEVELVKL